MNSDCVYKRVTSDGALDFDIKKSRFLVRYGAIDSRDQALAFVDNQRVAFPEARHHCWVYCVGPPSNPSLVAMSDDGEPSGTAAKPIMNAILGKGIGDICVVVVRYFGGVKLGAGGLIRAYGGSVTQALDQADTKLIKPKVEVEIRCNFKSEQRVRHWLDGHAGSIKHLSYKERVTMAIELDKDMLEDIKAFLNALQIEFIIR